jgi:nitrogen-specific signal transduction histidine kinase/CheY-like chemotaxis protein
MKTILVLAQHPDLPEAIRAALNPDDYKVVDRPGVAEAESILHPRLLDVCIVDVELSTVEGIWSIEKLRRRLPTVPVLVYTGAKAWEWEEEAYLQGVTHILKKPVRTRLLTTLLERLLAAPPRLGPAAPSRPTPRRELAFEPESSHREFQSLGVLRNLSAILTHSLCAEALLKQFLLLLREILGVNRALVFLRRPAASFGGVPLEEARCLRAACAIGLSSGLIEHFELATDSGIGGYLNRQGRVLRRNSDVAHGDVEIQKEFEVMGTEVAIPILDRETFLGVAAFDGRVTGEPLVNSELELIFHLLEEVGLAVKNIWLHDQLASNNEMMTDIFRQLSSACIVVSRDLSILHANKAARNFFARARRGQDLDFSDLPQVLGGKVYQVLKTGTAMTTFKYEPADSPGSVYHVSILPFQKQDAALPSSALLVAEDHTQAERLQRLEIETANLRLVRTMADRLAHEIGNALVPVSTHQQLLGQSYQDPEFRASLNGALSDSVKRISRLTSQMRFLARDSIGSKEAFPLERLVEEAYEEAKKHQPVRLSRLTYENGAQPVILAGDRAALKHAMTEVLINALQANPADAKIGVRTQTDESPGTPGIRIEVQDNGPGFAADLIQRASDPFFTTRNVGLGLGLTVSRKIIETHQGSLALGNTADSHSGLVRISLPAEPAA